MLNNEFIATKTQRHKVLDDPESSPVYPRWMPMAKHAGIHYNEVRFND